MNRRTPIHTAVAQNNIDCIQLLNDLGANLNITDMYRRTPIHTAVAQNNIDCIQLLNDLGESQYNGYEWANTHATCRISRRSR